MAHLFITAGPHDFLRLREAYSEAVLDNPMLAGNLAYPRAEMMDTAPRTLLPVD